MGIILLVGLALWAVERRGDAKVEDTVEQLEEIQFAQCVSGNASRVNQWSDALADEAMYRELEGQVHDPEKEAIWRRAAVRKAGLADDIVVAAEQRGELLTPGKPIIVCGAEPS